MVWSVEIYWISDIIIQSSKSEISGAKLKSEIYTHNFCSYSGKSGGLGGTKLDACNHCNGFEILFGISFQKIKHLIE